MLYNSPDEFLRENTPLIKCITKLYLGSEWHILYIFTSEEKLMCFSLFVGICTNHQFTCTCSNKAKRHLKIWILFSCVIKNNIVLTCHTYSQNIVLEDNCRNYNVLKRDEFYVQVARTWNFYLWANLSHSFYYIDMLIMG